MHVELQSSNYPDMALRMSEYALRIYRQLRVSPRRIVLTRLQDKIVTVREILGRIGKLDHPARPDALDLFLTD